MTYSLPVIEDARPEAREDETWMMTPEPCFNMPGRNPRSSRTAESKFNSSSCCQISSVNASAPPPGAALPPAALIRMSRPPKRSSAVLMMWSAPVRVVTSAWMKFAELSPRRKMARGGEHLPAAVSQAIHNRFSNSFCAAGHQDSFAGELVRVPSEGGGLHNLCFVLCSVRCSFHATTFSKGKRCV